MAWPAITDTVTKATKSFFESIFTEVERIATEAAQKTEAEPALAVATTNIASLKGLPGVVDGVTLAEGNVILLTAQTEGKLNGPWIVKGGTTAWERPVTYAEGSEQRLGQYIFVLSGTENVGTVWLMTNTSKPVVGTTATTWRANYAGSGVVTPAASTYEGFGIQSSGSYVAPPSSWVPYSSESAFNKAQAEAAALHAKSALYVQRMLAYNAPAAVKPTAGSAAGKVISATGNTLANGNAILWKVLNGGTGLATNTVYYVVGRAANTFELAATEGGAGISFSSEILATSEYQLVGKPGVMSVGEKGTTETFHHPVYYPKTSDLPFTIVQSGSYPVITDTVNLPQAVASTKLAGASLAGKVITQAAHGLVKGQALTWTALAGGTGLTTGTVYWVTGRTLNTFELALTPGGAGVAFSTELKATSEYRLLASPEPGSDKHLAIVMPTGTEYDMWEVTNIVLGVEGKPGEIKCTNAGKSKITDKGYGVNVATAADFSLLAGSIRIAEFEAACKGPKGSSLSHALFFVLPENTGSDAFAQGILKGATNSSYVAPATHGASLGNGSAEPNGNGMKQKVTTTAGSKTAVLTAAAGNSLTSSTNRLDKGTLVTGASVAAGTTVLSVTNGTEFQLSANATKSESAELTFTGLADTIPTGGFMRLNYTVAEVEALGLKKWEEVLILTLARFGMFCGDTSGGKQIGLQFESGFTWTSLGFVDPAIAFGIANSWFHNQETEESAGIFHFDDYAGTFSTGGGGAGSKKVDWARWQVMNPPAV